MVDHLCSVSVVISLLSLDKTNNILHSYILAYIFLTRGYNCDAYSMSSALEYFGGRSWPNVALHNQLVNCIRDRGT